MGHPPTQSQGLLYQDLDQVDQLSIYCEIIVLLGKNQYLNMLPNSFPMRYQTKVSNQYLYRGAQFNQTNGKTREAFTKIR